MDERKVFHRRYRLERQLYRRKSGSIYLVTDLKSNAEDKMMKIIPLREIDADDRAILVSEAHLLSQLNNEHIVKFLESFLEDDCLCIVTEFCEGGDLEQRLKELKKRNQSLDEEQVVQWLAQILIAVQYMHKSSILHRNLRARNIFLKNNQVKLGGFQWALPFDGSMVLAGTMTGALFSMAPEVVKQEGYEANSDIWAVGCLLYEMCALHRAFDGKGLMNVVYQIIESKTPDLPKRYSKELNDLLKKMLTKSASLRPNASEILTSRIFAPLNLPIPPRSRRPPTWENPIFGEKAARSISSIRPKNEMTSSFAAFRDQSPPELLQRRKMPKPFLSGIHTTPRRFVSDETKKIADRHEYPKDLHQLTIYPPTPRPARLLVAEPRFARSASKEDRVRVDFLAARTKIDHLRKKSIELLGAETFEKVYEYLSKQRGARTLSEEQIQKDLRAMTKDNAPTFLVDQLVSLELCESMK